MPRATPANGSMKLNIDSMNADSTNTNRLFPVFLKLENFKVLIVGGGFIGLEKLTALTNNAPATSIKMVAMEFSDEVRGLAANYPKVNLEQRKFEDTDLEGVDFVITALNDKETSRHIFEEAHRRKILINTADTPELCDFYLGSIVQKGNLKIAISTNGKSPTMAKRLKEWLNAILPDELDAALDKLYSLREQLRGDLSAKIKTLNKLTEEFVSGKSKGESED
jgi:siroheme synthase-like protein